MQAVLPRTKVFRDPLYGYINVDYAIINQLIDTKEVQRLRRICQLSGVRMVFQTAEHSRFTHSLGAYEIANLVVKNVAGAKENLSEYEQILFLVSALLHDIGHGPYSHAFEHVINVSHEEMTAKIISYPESEVNKVLVKNGVDPLDVAGIITHSGKYPLIEALISSQLDVDRLDYLSRDAYFTGATYGTIDRNRLLRSMIIKDKQLFFKASGVNSIESYIMSRYHMYWQVYYHPKARAYELLLQSIYTRIKDLLAEGEQIDANIGSFINVINSYDLINSYIDLDDAYVNGFIKQLVNSNDEILNKLANAFMNRRLFKIINFEELKANVSIQAIKDKYSNDSILARYFYYSEEVLAQAYLHVGQSSDYNINDIKIISNGHIVSLEDYSPIIKALVNAKLKKSQRIYYYEG